MMFGRISQNEAFSGIPGSSVDHGVADYCLTEEFVSVYRLHPLLPDKLEIHNALSGELIKEYTLPDGIIGDESHLTVLSEGATMGDIFYSFGVANPGAVTLHNYPNFLRKLTRPEQFGVAETVDLAAIDILRDRERGVPRYNRFRRFCIASRLRHSTISRTRISQPLAPISGASTARPTAATTSRCST